MKPCLTCPDCRTPLMRSSHRCDDCGWRPWYHTPIMLGMTILTTVTILVIVGILFCMDTPLAPIRHYLLEGPTQEYAGDPPRHVDTPAFIEVRPVSAGWQGSAGAVRAYEKRGMSPCGH